jgi:hypothetical protein
MATSPAGISDEVDVELNVERAPEGKGPVSVYVQQYDDGDQHFVRVVDRHGVAQEPETYESRSDATKAAKALAKELDGAQHESYPGRSGGPLLPASDPEGDQE